MNKRFIAALLLLCLFSGACAGKKAPDPSMDTPEDDYLMEYGPAQPDGLEKFNRRTFAFNDGVITHVFTPVNNVYTGLFPQDFRNGFGNFHRNLGYPARLVNSLLQFKLDKAAKETAAFVLNTFFGMGGLFNVAKGVPALKTSPEDFGQTLAFYGVGHGSYLVLPLLGPSSLRDAAGSAVDMVLHPRFWIQPDGLSYGLAAHEKTNQLSAILPVYQSMKAESLDQYTGMKDVYFQHRSTLESQ